MSKMLSTYGLTRLPFSKDIPTSEMLDTEALQAARERLKAALEGRASAVVTGDSGSGKTCLLRAMEEDLPQGRYRIHYVHNATVNRRDFYRQLSIGMGLNPAPRLQRCSPPSASTLKISPVSISCALFYCSMKRTCYRSRFWISSAFCSTTRGIPSLGCRSFWWVFPNCARHSSAMCFNR